MLHAQERLRTFGQDREAVWGVVTQQIVVLVQYPLWMAPMTHFLAIILGFVEPQIHPKRLPASSPMISGCMMCTEMCGSGLLIGGAVVILLLHQTLFAALAVTELYVGVLGTRAQAL